MTVPKHLQSETKFISDFYDYSSVSIGVKVCKIRLKHFYHTFRTHPNVYRKFINEIFEHTTSNIKTKV